MVEASRGGFEISFLLEEVWRSLAPENKVSELSNDNEVGIAASVEV